jgi:hypothetical protein
MYLVLALTFDAQRPQSTGGSRPDSTLKWRATWRTASTTVMASILCRQKPLIGDVIFSRPDGRKMSKSYDNTIPLFTPR